MYFPAPFPCLHRPSHWSLRPHLFTLQIADSPFTEYYLARPYNFNLSPLSADGVDLRLERVFSFSSSACDFLSKNNFEFGKVFTHGVPYLSREEEGERRDEYNQRADKNAKIPDIIIAADDSATLEFYRGARRSISTWAKNPKVCYSFVSTKPFAYLMKPELEFVNVSNPAGPLNGFQRRLVHQLVRNEFPTLRTSARNDGSFMQVTTLDVKREAEVCTKSPRNRI
jgi:poly(A)-specific ribonuclease